MPHATNLWHAAENWMPHVVAGFPNEVESKWTLHAAICIWNT
jgi:hypothetical protein